jgi:hypothetical protein
MQQVISPPNIHSFRHEALLRRSVTKDSTISRFFEWCNTQEKSRLFWLAIALLGGIGTVLPITLLAVVFFAGNNFNLWIITCVINVPILILNLAVQPAKVTLPVLFFAWFIDVLIIGYSITDFIMT